MDTEKIIHDLTSRDSQRIRESGLVVIQNSQNEKERIVKFRYKLAYNNGTEQYEEIY